MEGKRIVAIYARVSTEHEAQIAALENQIQYYDEIMERHPNWILYKRYIDEGITGTSVQKRKNFTKMMIDAEAGKFDLIITREVSRFARNTVDTLQETRKLKKMKIEVWFTEDNIWTMNDEDGELRLTIMATLAQNESKKTSLRVRAGQKISFEKGVPYGNGNILGYDKLPNHGGYIINDEQAETVKMIFDLYEQGKGMLAIKYILEQEGRLTATGLRRWESGNISRILNNPFYCGVIVYRKQYVADYLEQKKKRNFGEVEQIIVEGKHVPIVSKEQFDRVKEILRSKTKKVDDAGRHKAVRRSQDVYCHKLRCSCGSNFCKCKYHKYTSKRTGELINQFAYQCYSTKKYGSVQTRINKGLSIDETCTVKMIPRSKLEKIAKALVESLDLDYEHVISKASELLENGLLDANTQEYDLELNATQSEVERAKLKIANLVELRIADAIDMDTYLAKKNKLDERISYLSRKIEALQKEVQPDDSDLDERIERLKRIILERCTFLRYIFTDDFIEEIVESITVFPDYLEWRLRLGEEIIETVANIC